MTADYDWVAIGRLAKHDRLTHRQSQKEYGRALDLDQSQMSNLELGKFRDPDEVIIERLRQRLGPLPTIEDKPARTLEDILDDRLRQIESTLGRVVYLLEQQEKLLRRSGAPPAALVKQSRRGG